MSKTVYIEIESMDVGKIQRPGHFFLRHWCYRQLNYFFLSPFHPSLCPCDHYVNCQLDTTTLLPQLCSSQDKLLHGRVSVK